MKIENEFIPFEQALDLRELEFDELCICIYNREKALRANVFNNSNDRFKSVQLSYNNGKIPAPLYQQAFRFFREKYGLEIILAPDSFNDISKKLREYKIISYDKSWKIEEILEPSHWIRKGCFSTYEEAELACLKKLIEIVKK